MEEQLWKAIWKRAGRKYSVALVNHPKLRATGKTLDEAVEKLGDLISEELGDAVPHLEFVNPLPASGSGRFIFTLAGHNQNYDVINADALFDSAQCPKCHNQMGERNEELIQLRKPPEDDLMFTDWLGQIISRRLATFLKLQKCNEVILRPIVIRGKVSSEFLEVISISPRPYVAKKGVKGSWGEFWCKKCERKSIMYMPHEADYLHYVAADSLPDPKVSVFPVGVGYEVDIAVSKTLREAVIRSGQFKNVVSHMVGVLQKREYLTLEEYFSKFKRSKRAT